MSLSRLSTMGVAIVVASGVEAGCGAPVAPASSGSIIVSYASDFEPFRSWASASFDNAVAQGSTHVAGPRTVYINARPAMGATEFPLGTLIVKVTEADGRIFARAKRGGGYNSTGATDWEWFELQEGTAGVSIKWRGVGPPAGESYGGDPNGGCNGCHSAAAHNDFVMTPWLDLGSLGGDASSGAPPDGGLG